MGMYYYTSKAFLICSLICTKYYVYTHLELNRTHLISGVSVYSAFSVEMIIHKTTRQQIHVLQYGTFPYIPTILHVVYLAIWVHVYFIVLLLL